MCDNCQAADASREQRARALADERPDLGTEGFPPLPLPDDLTPRRLAALRDDYEAAYRRSPEGYQRSLVGWVVMGQAAMLGGGLLLIALVLAGVGALGGLLDVGVGLLALKALLAAKGLIKVAGVALVAGGAMIGRFFSSIAGVFRSGSFSIDALPGEEIGRDEAPGLFA